MIDRDNKYEEMLKATDMYNIMFVDDLCNVVSISRATFYKYYPLKSKRYEAICNKLEKNRANTKNAMRKKWFDSDNATLQVALYKIIGNDDDRKKLCSSYVELNDVSSEANRITTKDISELIKALKDE